MEYSMSAEHSTEHSIDAYLTWCLAHPGQSHTVDAGGNRVHYLEWSGPPQAPTLVLLHGFLGHAHWWDFIAPALAENYRVLAVDLGGMGDSGHRDQYSFDTYVAEVIDVIKQSCAAPITLIGHSFGGRCSILAASAEPVLVERLIVIDSHFEFPDTPSIRTKDFSGYVSRVKTRYPDLASAKSRFRLVPDEPDAHPVVRDHIAVHSLRQDGDAWIWKFDIGIMEHGPRMGMAHGHLLSTLPMPMDFVCGEHSLVVPNAHASQIMIEVKQGRGPIVIPAAHHHVLLGQPVTLVSVLRALLAQ
jgi:pimeloyl-ACP methyl ester carboxylesterase